MLLPSLLFIGTGLLYIALAVPLVRRKVKPNHFYGFRTEQAFSSDDVWYAINEYSARQMLRVGAVLIAAVPALNAAGLDEVPFTLVMTGILLGGTVFMTVRSLIHLKTLVKP